MNVADAEEYTQALGQVAAGAWRQIALGERLGVPTTLGLSTREWVEQRLGGYVRLSIPERREAVKELEAEGHSQREIADVLGVGKGTIDRDLKPVAPNGAAKLENPRSEAVEEIEPAPNGAPASDDSPFAVIAEAKDEARRAPAYLATKAMQELKLARDIIIDRAGGVEAILADLEDEFGDTHAALWLPQLDETVELLDTWRAGLRRRRIRSIR